MASSVTDPTQWTLPNPHRVIETLRSLGKEIKARPPRGSGWTFSSAIVPVDLYAFLKSRFGPPKAFMMTLRSPSVDNFIHWNYTLECPDTILDVMGLSMRTEIRAYSVRLDNADWEALEVNLRTEFERHRKNIREIQDSFERWYLFLNPYRRLAAIAERYERRLREISIPKVESPPVPATRDQVERFQKEMAAATDLYQETMALCVSLEMIAPVMGEAAVNFVMLIVAKPEIRNDQRLREDFCRRAIDVRIKSLHLVSDGIVAPITGSEEPFKDFLRIMNRRNDALHGNIDPRNTTGEEIFFDLRNIPLLRAHRSFSEIALSSALVNLSPESALLDVQTVRQFVEFLLARFHPDAKAVLKRAMEEQQLGFRPQTGTIGVILPAAQVDFFPIMEDPGCRGLGRVAVQLRHAPAGPLRGPRVMLSVKFEPNRRRSVLDGLCAKHLENRLKVLGSDRSRRESRATLGNGGP